MSNFIFVLKTVTKAQNLSRFEMNFAKSSEMESIFIWKLIIPQTGFLRTRVAQRVLVSAVVSIRI